MLKVMENVKSVKEFNDLYDAVEWGAYDSDISKKALDHTYYSVSVYDDNQIVGYGRLIGDGICFMYIHDVMVRPEYQNKKIGTMIMNKLIEQIEIIKKENPDMRTYLGAAKGKEEYYERYGFIKRVSADVGAGMIYIK